MAPIYYGSDVPQTVDISKQGRHKLADESMNLNMAHGSAQKKINYTQVLRKNTPNTFVPIRPV